VVKRVLVEEVLKIQEAFGSGGAWIKRFHTEIFQKPEFSLTKPKKPICKWFDFSKQECQDHSNIGDNRRWFDLLNLT